MTARSSRRRCDKSGTCLLYPNGYSRDGQTQAPVLGRLIEEGLQGVSGFRAEGPGRGPVRRPVGRYAGLGQTVEGARSEEHTSELQSLMRISYAVFCLKKKTTNEQ